MVVASRAPLAVNGLKMASNSRVYLQRNRVAETKAFISDLSRQFYDLGLRKERMVRDDMYVVSSSGSKLSWPISKSYPHKPPKSSDCAPLFLKAECYQYIFDSVVKTNQFGMDSSTPSIRVFGGHKDVNMTVKAGSLVSYNDKERSPVHDDLEQGIAGAIPSPSDDAAKEELIAALVANVQAMIRADRKITALKQLQGHIWRTGFQNNEIEGVVFDDVPKALEKWHASGLKVYIYSSGSRLAQRLIFGNTNYGDLRKYLCGFFDTRVGNKKETSSYVEISESLGVDTPSEVLFVTDVYQEAIAAKAAGLEVIISVRPGNGPLPKNNGFKTITSFSEI